MLKIFITNKIFIPAAEVDNPQVTELTVELIPQLPPGTAGPDGPKTF